MATQNGVKISGGLESLVTDLEEELNVELRRLATNFVTALAVSTPKKTGEATGEWQVTINKQASSKTGRKDLTGASVATEEGAVIDTAKQYKFPEIWVSNLADHIEDLNRGTSKQAPAKFIERALERAERAL